MKIAEIRLFITQLPMAQQVRFLFLREISYSKAREEEKARQERNGANDSCEP